MGIIKSNSDLRYLRDAAQAAGDICNELLDAARPEISTIGLEVLAGKLLAKHRSSAPFKNFDGFAHAICVSLNDEIINGPPSRERIIKEGDLISIAIGTELRGLHGKAARTVVAGLPSSDGKRLLEGTNACFERVRDRVEGVNTLNALLEAIPETATEYNLSLIEKLGGTGIGKRLHDYPVVPNNPADLKDEIPLEPGLAFTLMPIFKLGEPGPYTVHPDGWTYMTHDGALSAHFAETMLLTENGLEILSR